jgi:hypothetical protein
MIEKTKAALFDKLLESALSDTKVLGNAMMFMAGVPMSAIDIFTEKYEFIGELLFDLHHDTLCDILQPALDISTGNYFRKLG